MFLIYVLIFELIIGVILSLVLVSLANKFGFTDKPDAHLKRHAGEVPHVGGLIILITASLAYIVLQWGKVDYNFKQLVELAALVLLFEIGMVDDTRHLAVGWRLIMQIQVAAALVIAGNVFRPFPWDWANYGITILGIMTCINAINLMDIMDGLAGGVSFFVLAGLCYTYIAREIQTFYTLIGLVVMVAIIPFLISNFRAPPYKSFLGDSGSTMLGLLIAILFINSAQLSPSEAGIGTALVFISIPIFEIFFVSTMRIMQRRNPLKGSPDHFPLRLHTIMKKTSHTITVIYIWCILVLLGGVVIFHATTTIKIITTVVIGISFVGVWLCLARVKVHK